MSHYTYLVYCLFNEKHFHISGHVISPHYCYKNLDSTVGIICVDCSIYFHRDRKQRVILSLVRTSMLLYGVSADLHDEYFSIILMLISSHYMANYGSDPIWSVPGCSVTIIATIMVSHVFSGSQILWFVLEFSFLHG